MNQFSEKLAPLAQKMGVTVSPENRHPVINIPDDISLAPVGRAALASTSVSPPPRNPIISRAEEAPEIVTVDADVEDDDALLAPVSTAEIVSAIQAHPAVEAMVDAFSDMIDLPIGDNTYIPANESFTSTDDFGAMAPETLEAEFSIPGLPPTVTMVMSENPEVTAFGNSLEAAMQEAKMQHAFVPSASDQIVAQAAAEYQAANPGVDEFNEEIMTKDKYLAMVEAAKMLSTEKMEKALIAALPALFSARTITGESDVAIYIAENAFFRDVLMQFFRMLEIEIPKDEIEKLMIGGESRAFISRAPNLFQMRQASALALSIIERLKNNDGRFVEIETVKTAIEGKLALTLSDLTEANQKLKDAQVEIARLHRLENSIGQTNQFRIRWELPIKGATEFVWLMSKVAIDPNKPEKIPVPASCFWTKDHAEALIFSEFEIAQSTLEMLKRNSEKLREKVSKAFSQVYLTKAVIEQTAFIDHRGNGPAPKI